MIDYGFYSHTPFCGPASFYLGHINFSLCNAHKLTAALTTPGQRVFMAVDAGRGKDCPGIETEVPCGLNLPKAILLI